MQFSPVLNMPGSGNTPIALAVSSNIIVLASPGSLSLTATVYMQIHNQWTQVDRIELPSINSVAVSDTDGFVAIAYENVLAMYQCRLSGCVWLQALHGNSRVAIHGSSVLAISSYGSVSLYAYNGSMWIHSMTLTGDGFAIMQFPMLLSGDVLYSIQVSSEGIITTDKVANFSPPNCNAFLAQPNADGSILGYACETGYPYPNMMAYCGSVSDQQWTLCFQSSALSDMRATGGIITGNSIVMEGQALGNTVVAAYSLSEGSIATNPTASAVLSTNVSVPLAVSGNSVYVATPQGVFAINCMTY